MNSIFISFSHTELKPLVESLISALNGSTLLQRCQIRPFHIAEFDAFRKAPIENTVHCVSRSRCLINLIGKDLGEVRAEGKSHIECEVNAALDNQVDVLTFLVGKHHADSATQPESVREFLSVLPSHFLRHHIQDEHQDDIVDSIVKQVETFLWASLGCDDNPRMPESSLLKIDGISPSTDTTESPHHDQFRRIFDKPDPSLETNPIASSLAQRKDWAFQSMELNHLSEATQNLVKATEEFGSDFFSCFWLGRIYALQTDTSANWKSAIPLSERAISSLKEDETLLASACNSHIAIAYAHIGDFEKAAHYFDLALAQYETFEVLERKTDMLLNQFALNNNPHNKQLAVEALSTFIRTNLKYYLAASEHFSKKNPTSFAEAEGDIHQELDALRVALTENYGELQPWADSAFNIAFPESTSFHDSNDILLAIYAANQKMWENFAALRACSTSLLQFYESHAQQRKDLETHNLNLDNDHGVAISLIDELATTIDERKTTNAKESDLQTRVSKEKRNLVIWDISLLASLGILAWCYFLKPEFIWLSAALSVGLLIVRFYFKSRHSVATLRIKSSKAHRRFINESVTELVENAMHSMALPHMRSIVERLKSAPNYLNHEDLAATKSALNDFVENQRKAVDSGLATWELKSLSLKKLIREWLGKVAQFEQLASSSINTNVTGRINQSRNVHFFHPSLLTNNSEGMFGEPSDKHCFQKDGSQMLAWFDNPVSAIAMQAFYSNEKPVAEATSEKTLA
ncbi:hypothetical protein LRP49_19570 [Enterovibrio sp. ZSDZ35]|uniref:TIR domain-containing protein n=1 Tax=Enterovibrio qingdaonensis TaxID=2899818 RepID=A0ABT5QS28_9GAMM|nr:hypothetical protein [Enterovibrio sp. ZSDZ35]MDD1783374.1 hypothetical protein [Enterovibrio sp. ZSDZ35]